MLLFDRLVLLHGALQVARIAFVVAVFVSLRIAGHFVSRRLLTAPLDPLARALVEVALGFAS